MIQCPNHSCQASNAETNRFCHRCRAPVPRRLLWAVGYQSDKFNPGDVISGRYLCKASRIFLDQQPGVPPGSLSDVPKAVLPYLHLVPYQLHLPQVYGWVDAQLSSGEVTRLMLLENAAVLSVMNPPTHVYPIDPTRFPAPASTPKRLPCLLPSLRRAWSYAPGAQQLHWLWQLAQLWTPFINERVGATLLKEHLIRVEGPLIRIVELRFSLEVTSGQVPQGDDITAVATVPTLAQLGDFWLTTLMPDAAPEIRNFGQSLCEHMVQGRLVDATVLQRVLVDAIQQVGRSQTIHVQIATQTDKGPSRANNEDACFPPEGSVMVVQDKADVQEDMGLVVVCDGIGGHQGGDVASALAIKKIAQLLRRSNHVDVEAHVIQSEVKAAIAQANDAISQSNDDNQRRERQRMGTTLVMGLLHGHACYIAHVGDSRAYWITQWGCHQLTLDDDVVSRETRLGYGTYRSILYQPNSGALVQALGMGASRTLYPTIQRLLLAGDGLLLLCSDGLSDYDLVETCWESILLPVLKSKVTDLGAVSQQLVEIANSHNGHDNVTVGLVRWQVSQTAPIRLDGVKDLSVFMSQAPEGDRPTPGQRPITALSALPESQEIIEPSLSSPIGRDNPAFDHPTTTRQEADYLSQTNRSDQADGRQPVDTAEPAIGLSRLPLSDRSPTIIPPVHNANGETPSSIDSPAGSGLYRRIAIVGAIASLGLIGLLALVYVWVPAISDRINDVLGIEAPFDQPVDNQTVTEGGVDTAAPSDSPFSSATHNQPLKIGSVVQLKSLDVTPQPSNGAAPATPPTPQPLLLFALNSDQSATTTPDPEGPQVQVLGVVPWGSILSIKGSFEVPDPALAGGESDPTGVVGETPVAPRSDSVVGDDLTVTPGRWLEVQLCAVPTTGNPSPDPSRLSPGVVGWVSESDLKFFTERQISPAAEPNDLCTLSPDEPAE